MIKWDYEVAMQQRKATFQSLAWFWDLYRRKLLNMDPPYQRRSIWNQQYKDFFVDTVLNGYPCPAIFLHENISPEGTASYSVVDGKQRLLTLFEFAGNEYPVAADATSIQYRDKYFKDLDDDTKRAFWRYQFSVEFVPSEDEALINNIFDRINRNVAKLTRQELRHAKFDGRFITRVEDLSVLTYSLLPKNFPFIQSSSRRQMKDDEFVAQLLLLIEEGPKSYSQDDLDLAFSARDVTWETEEVTIAAYERAVRIINEIIRGDDSGEMVRSRLRNQADFYSLVGAIYQLTEEGGFRVDVVQMRERLRHFISLVEEPGAKGRVRDAEAYYAASRSASNDVGPRTTRINILKGALTDRLAIAGPAI